MAALGIYIKGIFEDKEDIACLFACPGGYIKGIFTTLWEDVAWLYSQGVL